MSRNFAWYLLFTESAFKVYIQVRIIRVLSILLINLHRQLRYELLKCFEKRTTFIIVDTTSQSKFCFLNTFQINVLKSSIEYCFLRTGHTFYVLILKFETEHRTFPYFKRFRECTGKELGTFFAFMFVSEKGTQKMAFHGPDFANDVV